VLHIAITGSGEEGGVLLVGGGGVVCVCAEEGRLDHELQLRIGSGQDAAMIPSTPRRCGPREARGLRALRQDHERSRRDAKTNPARKSYNAGVPRHYKRSEKTKPKHFQSLEIMVEVRSRANVQCSPMAKSHRKPRRQDLR